jgi:hypothetical protein
MLVEETNHVKNLSKGITSSRKQDIALKASRKSKKKQIVIERVRKKKKEKEWLSSSITTTSSWLKEELSRETKEKSQGLEAKECAIIVVRMGTSLLNAPMREGKKMKTTTRRKTIHTPKTRKTRSTTRRSPMLKLILDKSGTQMMRALTQIVKIWQPLPSRETPLLASHSFQISPSTHASWPKKARRR